MANSYFANTPISEPVRGDFVMDHDFDGFGWDKNQGLFIPVNDEISQFVIPGQSPDDVR